MKNGYAVCLNKWVLDESIKNELRLLLIISSLCAKDGYCYASNEYLANIFNETERSISVKIKKLESKGYLHIEYERIGTVIKSREIRLTKKSTAIDKNINRTDDKNIKENNINSINNKNINKKEIYKEKFEMFYKEYPKHVKRAEVEKWFFKNEPDDELFNTMMIQLSKFKKSDEWKNKKYIPYPTSWLNQKRWEDEIKTQEEIDKEILKYLEEEE